MKKRTIRKSTGAIPVDHPDGGRFHIRPMSFDEAVKYAELVTKEEFERDTNGSIVFNPKGEVLKRYAGGDPHEHIDFANDLIDDVEGIEFEEGTPFDRTPENMRVVLTLMGTDEWEFEVDVDAEGNEIVWTPASDEPKPKKVGTKKVMKPVRENLFIWVTRKSAKLAEEQSSVAKGN